MRIIHLVVSISILTPYTYADETAPYPTPHLMPYSGKKAPFRRRRRHGLYMKARGTGLIDISKWPKEPKSPDLAQINQHLFSKALVSICGWMPKGRAKNYSKWILNYSKQFDIDPFLLAALIYRQSLCIPNQEDNYGRGLSGINLKMHQNSINRRIYYYWIIDQGKWKKQSLALKDFLFYETNLRRSKSNIYFAAALLSIYKKQHPGVCAAFGSVPHRHFVSHFIWGDRVRDSGAEDRILRARRRFLDTYFNRRQKPKSRYQSLRLHFPLDAPPRRITSGLGDIREDGKRRHRGLDISSTFGEPVYAIADGKIIVAGIDARVGPSKNMTSKEAQAIKSSELGPGGLYVMIRHDAENLVSAYMHLSRYSVTKGQRIKAGECIGYVGRSGMKISSAHLHFELRVKGKHIDPTPYFREELFTPEESFIGQKLLYEKKRKRHQRKRKH